MSQGSLVVPTSGTLSGLTAMQGTNAALDALATCSSGASTPNNAASGPEQGQLWLDQSGTQPVLRQYDGTDWLPLGTLNSNDHIWEPPIGGGAASLASASTVDLGSIPQNFISITGTTAITSFGTSMVEGTAKFVKFAGTLALTYNSSSMILPTGASILTSPGDTAVVVALGGGNFEVVSYQPVAGSVPPGAGMEYYGAAAPSGWLFPYGQPVSRTSYAALFAAIGTTYGAGDGSTTFNLPDKRGRVSAAADAMGGTAANRLTAANTGGVAGTVGSAGGEQSHTLGTPEMPNHGHTATATDSGHPHNIQSRLGSSGGNAIESTGVNGTLVNQDTDIGYANITVSVANTGGGGAHNNVQPTIVCNYIIKY